MREITIDKLKPIPSLPSPVLHKSGTPLLRPGEELTESIINTLRNNDIESVFFLEATERIDEARRHLTHMPLDIQNLTPGDELARTLYDDQGHLLLEAGTPIPKSFADSLSRRGITTIYFRKPEEEVEPKVGRKIRSEIDKIFNSKGQLVDEEVMKSIEDIQLEEANADDLDASKLEAKINSLASIDVKPTGEPFLEQVKETRDAGPATQEEKDSFTGSIGESINDLKNIFKSLQNGSRSTEIEPIDRVASRAMGGLIRNRELLVLCGTANSTEEYIVSHALAMTVVAVNIGTTMGFGGAQIKSLAYGAMLSDIGMLKVPEEILNKTDKLTPAEHAEIRRHPAYGLDILQKISRIPSEVPYIVYQSHERANGSGYPCGKKDVVIHPFAKIVGIADIFSSVCSTRPYRKAKTPYEAMEQLVLMTGKRQLSADTVRSFLSCNSMFPVGSFVKLNNNMFARVVVPDRKDYMRPTISVLINESGNVMGTPDRVHLTEQKDISVTQAIEEEEIIKMGIPLNENPMIGF